VVFLVGYWVLQMFVPVPGHEWGVFKEGAIFGDWLYDHSNGLIGKPWKSPYGRGYPHLPMWTHAASAMFGVFAAYIITEKAMSNGVKLRWLLTLGVVCLAVSLLWSLHLPIVKNRWTSTFALWCAGLSYLLLALFWWVIDVCNWRWGLSLFVAIGSNSILAYIMASLLMSGFGAVAWHFFGNVKPYLDSYWHQILIVVVQYLLAWGVLIHLHRQKIFLRL
jgi:predicted acyltransferase